MNSAGPSRLATIDFETSSLAGYLWSQEAQAWRGPPGASKPGLPAVGAEPYSKHLSAAVIWLAYNLHDGSSTRLWCPGASSPEDLFDHIKRGGLVEAWNAAFEKRIWANVLVDRLGWPPILEGQWRCAQAKSRASALPGSLTESARVLGLKSQKLKTGDALINRFSKPHKPSKKDPRVLIFPEYEPGSLEYESTLEFGRYCVGDVAAEMEASSVVPDLHGEELAFWQAHERINDRGVKVDVQAVDAMISVVEQVLDFSNKELLAITGVPSASMVQRLLKWLGSQGLHLPNLSEEVVAEQLQRVEEDPFCMPFWCARVLKIRSLASLTSVKKLYAIKNRLSGDGRLRDLYQYHGARTGRSTGEGPQPTNMPSKGPDLVQCGQWERLPTSGKEALVPGSGCARHHHLDAKFCPHCGAPRHAKSPVRPWSAKLADECRQFIVRTPDARSVSAFYGDVLHVVSGCLRSLFISKPDHVLVSSDYNSIEAVGLAMLAGQQWRIEVFQSGQSIYEAGASKAYGVPLEDFQKYRDQHGQHHPLRQKGKIGELAFGYQGWLGSAKAFDMPGTDDEIKQDILAWRKASPAVVWLWGGQTKGKAAEIVKHGLQGDGRVGGQFKALAASSWRDETPCFFGVEGALMKAGDAPDVWHSVERLDGSDSGISFCRVSSTLYCRIPSGRVLTYHSVEYRASPRGGRSFQYSGWNSNPKNGPPGWIRIDSWGGRMVENITQATCRDILRAAVLRLEDQGRYPVVLHVYDEIVSEVPAEKANLPEFEALMEVRPAWAADWPIRAPGGYVATHYRKG